jgi:hypothetical protein
MESSSPLTGLVKVLASVWSISENEDEDISLRFKKPQYKDLFCQCGSQCGCVTIVAFPLLGPVFPLYKIVGLDLLGFSDPLGIPVGAPSKTTHKLFST